MIVLDAENAVVRLCVAGIEAERTGDGDAALAHYTRAWEMGSDDAERCVAAHYLARAQADVADRLRWNALALELAQAAGDLDAFLPSLRLNLGSAHEELGHLDQARRQYLAAADALAGLRDDPMAMSLTEPIARALRRVAMDRAGLPRMDRWRR